MNKISFKNRWASPAYRQKYLIYILFAICLIIAMPYGFDFIQGRGGIKLNDSFLDMLPAIDCSIPIFVLMYSVGVLIIYRVYQNPHLLLLFLKSYLVITLFRFLLIYLIPLDPPVNMVELRDPITKIFYGGKLITRDLFFSGHTSTMLLVTLIFERNWEKYYGLFVTFFIAFSLLFQHVHYAIDVVAAFPITWLIWRYFSYEKAGY